MRVLMLAVAVGWAALSLGIPASSQASAASGAAYAWGNNSQGQLGSGNTTTSTIPVSVNLPAGVAATVMAAGGNHSLAVGSDSRVYSWGFNGRGQLGNGTTANSDSPVRVSLPDGIAATSVAAGDSHSLAVDVQGRVYAWGDDSLGQLGNGSTTSSPISTPIAVRLPSGITATTVAAGFGHSLALGSDGSVYAWGYNGYGQLGDGNTTDTNLPVRSELPSGVTATAIAAGYEHSLALGTDGKIYSWGNNQFGQLGDGSVSNSTVPVVVGMPDGASPVSIAAGGVHSLALGSHGQAYAWGSNGIGQLGTGTTSTSPVASPVAVSLPTGVTFTAIGAGYSHSLAIGSNGRGYAWGSNAVGQLGNGSTTKSAAPTPVALPPGYRPLALGTGSTAAHSLAVLASMGATAAPAVRFSITRGTHWVVFRWRVVADTGLRGFVLSAGPVYLNRSLIPVRAAHTTYRYTVNTQVQGRVVLSGLLSNGRVVTLAHG